MKNNDDSNDSRTEKLDSFSIINYKKSGTRYKTLFEKAIDLIFVFDSHGNIIDVNRMATKRTGLSRNRLLKMNFFDIVPEGAKEALDTNIKILLEKGWHIFETSCKDQTGKLIRLEVNCSIIDDNKSRIIHAIARDLTHRSQDEPYLELLDDDDDPEQEDSSSKEDTTEIYKQDLIQNILNIVDPIHSQVNVISEFVKFIKSQDLKENQIRFYLKKLKTASQSVVSFFNRIKFLLNIETGSYSVESLNFSIKKLMSHISRMFLQIAQEKKLTINFSIADEIPDLLNGDPYAINHILANLITNAIKFTNKGSINVNVEIDNSFKQEGKSVCLKFTVKDTGIGIPQDDIPKLFKPFSKSQNSGEDKVLGLGLSICNKLIQISGGKIWFESIENRGSSFSFVLNFDTSKEGKKHIAEENSEAILNSYLEEEYSKEDAEKKLKNARVLVVEDDPSTQRLISKILEKAEIIVDVANNGKEALEYAKNSAIDAILLDIQMPIMDGYDAAQALRKSPYKLTIPIIAMTAYSIKGARVDLTEAGIDDFLIKPIDIEKLFLTLAKWIKPAL
ncbi:MAG: response regulator [Desulfobacterales bacterium]|nr:response regulator [Desulfobacterales bacterium]